MTFQVGFASLSGQTVGQIVFSTVSRNSEPLRGTRNRSYCLPCVAFLMVPFPGGPGVFAKNGGIFSARTIDPSQRPEREGAGFKMLVPHALPHVQPPGAVHPLVFVSSLLLYIFFSSWGRGVGNMGMNRS